MVHTLRVIAFLRSQNIPDTSPVNYLAYVEFIRKQRKMFLHLNRKKQLVGPKDHRLFTKYLLEKFPRGSSAPDGQIPLEFQNPKAHAPKQTEGFF